MEAKPNFVLIDHSLERVGGHHFEYAMHLLREVDAAGFRILLAANRRFRERRCCPPGWRLLPVFRDDTYGIYAKAAHGARRPIRRFACTCADVFRQLKLGPRDHVFLATMSQYDLQGLVDYLESDPGTQLPAWHLQFHFGLLKGRSSEYAAQQTHLDAMRQLFRTALARVPKHRLQLLTTTQHLADQYNLLRVATFRTLPYPVNPSLFSRQERSTELPLRVTCAGHIRKEKGRFCLPELVKCLWPDYVSTGRIQLRVQGPRWRMSQLARIASAARWSTPRPQSATPPIVFTRHPLPADQYASLIRETDIGLFLYDSDRYVGRCSGILVEMLAAGVPVIVPAGCWLSNQISQPIQDHLESFREQVSFLPAADSAAEQLNGTWATARAEMRVPHHAVQMWFTFQRLDPDRGDAYLRCVVQQFDAESNRLPDFTTVVDPASGQPLLRALVPIRRGATRVRLEVASAYDTRTIRLTRSAIRFLAPAQPSGLARPAGKVGLIGVGTRQFADLLREVVDHYDHYRSTALQFSRQWSVEHHPRNTLSVLLRNASSSRAEVNTV